MIVRKTLAGWMSVIEFCAEEVRRQYYYETGQKKTRGPLAVGWMLDAWAFALKHTGPLDEQFVQAIGVSVEPEVNWNGFRRQPVYVGNEAKIDWQEVPRQISNLLAAVNEGRLEPTHPKAASIADQFYYEYEWIHPFSDGNGRSGKILFNLINGTLLAPVWPVNFFGDIINP